MHVQEQIDTVTAAYDTYLKEENPTNIPFFCPTYGFHPSSKAKIALEKKGFQHVILKDWGPGYSHK